VYCAERNQVAFTPTQIEAIRAGMHYGLTMVRVISPRNKMLFMFDLYFYCLFPFL